MSAAFHVGNLNAAWPSMAMIKSQSLDAEPGDGPTNGDVLTDEM